MRLTNVTFEDRVIEDERLELGGEDAVYFLGRNLTLRHCTLVLHVPGLDPMLSVGQSPENLVGSVA